jgi:hypothetical protein
VSNRCVPSTAATVLAKLVKGAHCDRAASHSCGVSGMCMTLWCLSTINLIILLHTLCTCARSQPNCCPTSLNVVVFANLHNTIAKALSQSIGSLPTLPSLTHPVDKECDSASNECRDKRKFSLNCSSSISGTASSHHCILRVLRLPSIAMTAISISSSEEDEVD